VLNALSTTAPTIIAMRTGMKVGVGSSHSPASTVIAMTMTLAIVPMPGRFRSGIQPSSTATPTTAEAMPMVMPVCRASPWWKTSHGSRPSPARTITAIEKP
jgi:hypothetical protein